MKNLIVLLFVAGLFAQAPLPSPQQGGNSATGGTGTVTQINTSCGVTGGPVTTTGTISQTVATAAHNGSYAILTGDCGKSLTTNTAAAWTIAQAGTTGFEAGKFWVVNNVGSGALTVTATTSTFYGGPTANISGSVLTVPANTSATIISDGTNYQVLAGGGGSTSAAGQVTALISGPTRYTVNIGVPAATSTWVVNAITPTFVTAPTASAAGDLNDLTVVGGVFTGATTTYNVCIVSQGTPDAFSWGTGASCTSGSASVNITGAAQTLSNGFAITFGATTGHALTKWQIVATVGSAVATAATTQNINIFTMPARGKMVGITLKQSTAFTGIANENGTNGLIMSVGWASANAFFYGAGNSPITAGCDLGQAVSNTQQCDIGGWVSPTFASFTVTATVQSSCSAGSCFLSGLQNTSSVDVWPSYAVLP